MQEMPIVHARLSSNFCFHFCLSALLLGVTCFVGCADAGKSSDQEVASKFRPAAEVKATAKSEGVSEKAASVAPAKSEDTESKEAPAKPLISAVPEASENSTVAMKPAEKKEESDADDANAAMVRKLQELAEIQPRGRTREQQLQSVLDQIAERLKIAERLAGDPQIADNVRNEALKARVEAYAMLVRLQQPQANERLLAAAQDLASTKDPEYANLGKAQLFMLKMMKVFELEPRDGAEIVKSLENFLQEMGDSPLGFQPALSVVQLMEERNFKDDVKKATQLLVSHYSKSSTPEIVLQAQSLQIGGMVDDISNAPEGERAAAEKALVQHLTAMLEKAPGNEQIGQLLLSVAGMLEGVHDGAAALAVYKLTEERFGASKNQRLADYVRQASSNAEKRLSLLGKPFVVDGLLPDGTPFDWSKYQGKVVLIDFWATWCRPCLEEMSNIKKNYDDFHDKGFDVVGINLDDNLDDLNTFFEKQKLPWSTVISADDKKRGFEHPMAVKCGIDSIPFVVLVGRDGKVLGIHVRGEKLAQRLEKEFSAVPTDGKPAEQGARRGGDNPLR